MEVLLLQRKNPGHETLYVLDCKRAEEIMGSTKGKEEIWRLITTLEGDRKELEEVATCLQRLYREINR